MLTVTSRGHWYTRTEATLAKITLADSRPEFRVWATHRKPATEKRQKDPEGPV